MHRCMALLPCLHSTCAGCAAKALAVSDRCPTCRAPVEGVQPNVSMRGLIEGVCTAEPLLARQLEDTTELDEEERFLEGHVERIAGQTLHHAILEHDVEQVRRKLLRGAAVNERLQDGCSMLRVAVELGNLRIIRLLLLSGAHVNEANNQGTSSLHLASNEGRVEVLRVLLLAGEDVSHATTIQEFSSLYLASEKGHTECVRALLGANADVNQLSINGVSALFAASQKGHVEVVEVLLAAGADITQSDNDGNLPLHAASHQGRVRVVWQLTAFQLPPRFSSPVNQAVVRKLTAFQTPPRFGSPVNQANSTGTTALQMASHGGHTGVVGGLLLANADVDQTSNEGATALYAGCSEGHVEIVRLLLLGGAEVNAALVAASSSWKDEIVSMLRAAQGKRRRLGEPGQNTEWVPRMR